MCTRPINLKVPHCFKGATWTSVPCGTCAECLKQKQNDWMIRLIMEFRDSCKAIFFTLTYSEDTVPLNVDVETGEAYRTLHNDDVKRALKRFRINYERNLGYKPKFKYLITGEYGLKNTKRGHYHGIVFGLTIDEFWPFLVDWEHRYGYVDYDIIPYGDHDHYNVSKYVSKYCCKGIFECPYVAQGLVQKPRRMVSRGLGISYVEKMRFHHLGYDYSGVKSYVQDIIPGDILTNPYLTEDFLSLLVSRRRVSLPHPKYGSVEYHMPVYYRNKIYGTKTYLSDQMSDFLYREFSRIRDCKAREILATNLDWTCAQAYDYLDAQDALARIYREEAAKKSIANFYKKSKF